MDLAGYLPGVVDDVLESFSKYVAFVVLILRNLLQLYRNQRHSLIQIVVEFSGNAGALVLAGADQLTAQVRQRLFRGLAVGDVDAGTDIAEQFAVGRELRSPGIKHPSELSVGSAKP